MIKIASKVEDLLEKKGIKVRNFLFTARAHLMDLMGFFLKDLSPRLSEPVKLEISFTEQTEHFTLSTKIYLIRNKLYYYQTEMKHNKDITSFHIIRDTHFSSKELIYVCLNEAYYVQLYNYTKDEKFLRPLKNLYSKYGFSEEKVKRIMEYRRGEVRLKDLLTVF